MTEHTETHLFALPLASLQILPVSLNYLLAYDAGSIDSALCRLYTRSVLPVVLIGHHSVF